MRLEEFTRLLDRLGTGLDGWPSRKRLAGEKLLRDSAAARARLAAAQRLDELLARDRADVPDRAQARAVINAAMARIPPRSESTWAPDGGWLLLRHAGVALVSLALAGWIAGWMIAPLLDPPPLSGVPAISVLLGEAGPLTEEMFP